MKRFEQIRDLIMSLEDDFSKFYDKQNQAAGTRVRKGMQDMKKPCSGNQSRSSRYQEQRLIICSLRTSKTLDSLLDRGFFVYLH